MYVSWYKRCPSTQLRAPRDVNGAGRSRLGDRELLPLRWGTSLLATHVSDGAVRTADYRVYALQGGLPILTYCDVQKIFSHPDTAGAIEGAQLPSV